MSVHKEDIYMKAQGIHPYKNELLILVHLAGTDVEDPWRHVRFFWAFPLIGSVEGLIISARLSGPLYAAFLTLMWSDIAQEWGDGIQVPAVSLGRTLP